MIAIAGAGAFGTALAVALGREGREVLSVPFATFVAPGLIVMAMMQNAFANSSFSLLGGKIQGTIIDYLMPPLSPGELMAGIIGAAITRALAVGCTVGLAMALGPGVSLAMAHPWAVVWFALMGSLLLSALGLATSIWAEKFDHNAAVTNFVIVPLTFLSGTFYDVKVMVEPFEAITHLNPIFYMIDGYRYGHIGVANGSLQIGVIYTGLLALGSTVGVWAMFRNGYKLKA